MAFALFILKIFIGDLQDISLYRLQNVYSVSAIEGGNFYLVCKVPRHGRVTR